MNHGHGNIGLIDRSVGFGFASYRIEEINHVKGRHISTTSQGHTTFASIVAHFFNHFTSSVKEFIEISVYKYRTFRSKDDHAMPIQGRCWGLCNPRRDVHLLEWEFYLLHFELQKHYLEWCLLLRFLMNLLGAGTFCIS